jgi:hypothetical protein
MPSPIPTATSLRGCAQRVLARGERWRTPAGVSASLHASALLAAALCALPAARQSTEPAFDSALLAEPAAAQTLESTPALAMSPGIVRGIGRRGIHPARIAMVPNGSDLDVLLFDGPSDVGNINVADRHLLGIGPDVDLAHIRHFRITADYTGQLKI